MSKVKVALSHIRDLPANELVEAADKARDDLFRLKLASYTNQVQDTASIRNKRRELARILTVMGSSTRAATSAAAAEGDAAPAEAEVEVKPVKVKAAKPKHVGKPKAEAKPAKAAKSTKKKKEG